LGKTFVGSNKLNQLNKRNNLVVCQKSKVDDWVEHLKNNYDNMSVFDLTKEKDFIEFCTRINLDLANKLFVGVINYDLVWRRKGLSNLVNFTLMLDESSLIQHKSAKRTKFITKKLKPDNIILLSGTPTSGKYENLLTQINLLGWDISEETFWNQYIDWEWMEIDGYYQRKANDYKNVDRLKRKLRQHGCVFLKTEDVLDLPDQVDMEIKVNVTSDYKKFHKNKIININGEELVGLNVLTQMLYERQLCGQFNADKLKAFEDLLNSTEDRLIVFYNFNEELDRLRDIVDRPVSIVNGKEKDLDNYEECNNSVTFIQYQAGAMGLNLQKANKIIYFTPPLSSELFEQSKKRIHRIGQESSCFYYYLVCKNSIEEKIYKTLAMRRDYTEELFNEE